MTDVFTRITVEGNLAKLLIPSWDDLTISLPDEDAEARRLNPHPAGEAWCAWWIERNGDAPMKLTSAEGKVAAESLFAFRAGWDQAAQ